MWIRNVDILCEDDKLHYGELRISDGRIEEINVSETGLTFEEYGEGTEQDSDGILIPGLIDIHFHGCLGEDVCDGDIEGMRKIARYEASSGITSIVPATLTLSEEELYRVLSVMAEWKRNQGEDEADLLGINMEGPFISRKKKGAQNEAYIKKCDVDTAVRFIEASGGLVKFIGLAPEENPDFEEYVKALKGRVKLSLAHSNANYHMANLAFKAGVSHAVHLFNAMTGLSHREPGAVGAVFDNKNVTAELITDGIHIHPTMVRLSFQLMGRERMILISDSLRATGMPDGRFMLGGQEVEKRGGLCTLVSDGNIAGSASNLMDCLRTAVLSMGIPFSSAVRAASLNPAVCLGVEDSYGSIGEGKFADLLLLSPELELKQVWKSGKKLVGNAADSLA